MIRPMGVKVCFTEIVWSPCTYLGRAMCCLSPRVAVILPPLRVIRGDSRSHRLLETRKNIFNMKTFFNMVCGPKTTQCFFYG